LNMNDGTLEDDVFIWETIDCNIAAVLNREAPGSVFLQVHPNSHVDELIMEMLSTAEQHLTAPTAKNRKTLHVWVATTDPKSQIIMRERGYTISSNIPAERQRMRDLGESIPSKAAADGYTIKSMGDADDHPARCYVSWRAFHPDEPDDDFEGGWYHNVQKAPLYRRDLDLVAVAPDGEFAAFCTIWFDDYTRTGLFEPVGTVPEHRRHGLGRAILIEGLSRLKSIGAEIAYVGSYSEPAHYLYASVGFKTYHVMEPWIREI
jgi:mycothiol synthase